MPLKDIWKDKVNNVDAIDAQDINDVAGAVIELEGAKVDTDKAIAKKIELWQPNTEYKTGNIVLAPIETSFENGYGSKFIVAYFVVCNQDHKSSANFNGQYWDLKQIVNCESAICDHKGNIIADTFATKEEVGDIETALDSIIAIQNELIGGGSV